MIRVNLLEPGRQAARAAAGAPPSTRRQALAAGLIVLATAVGIGWRYQAVAGREAALDNEIAAARQQEAGLAGVLQQVRQFEARREEIERRVGLIDELRRGQSAPVHMIDQISRALPDGMWLTRVQQAGLDVTIEGECVSLTALSDFVGNLEASRYFARPVEILDSAVVAARAAMPEVIRFSVKGRFQMAGVPGTAPDPPRPAGARGTDG